MDKLKCRDEHMPTLYGAVVLYIPCTAPTELLRSELKNCNNICVYEDCIEVTYKEIQNVCTWELDELLTMLFAKCDFKEISNLLEKYQGTALIDIAFYHREKYPALVFSGKNMDIIHFLHADISIDPY